ncbi:hypothetical protein [Prevotella bivia]|uniref:Lipoprotein n=1 Tax=Prevotella bivia DSM 20514 TaxID=868129 RepID=I4Z7R0_9BACT|nr:hypothetical protein [Prevotella bivia]EFB93333.1 hypothetical protein HMPREF0648_1015 [Prevotella bivia JCVIHMP010]EIM32252.1 hypothetical protein PrebiDRAFT_0499 [Prevotella bivia DSM 20514]KGF35989.1 hypothetical protein HMPREF2136_08670 [Prevotella bivia DNF00650]
MKIISFITFAACVTASALMSSCSNEENAATNGQLTAFTGGIVTEAPMSCVQLGASESSTVAPGFLTRTSMERPAIGGKGTFFWEKGDVIYVQDDNNKFFQSQSNIADKTARNTFLVNGAYGANTSYDVYYNGTQSGSDPKKVVIAATQEQAAFNDTKHFGASGDCGVAKAEKNTEAGKSGYKFDLEHKASYLCFLPYITSKEQRENYKIQSIELTSNNNIAGTYDLSSTGLSGEGSSKTITLRAGENGLLLADKTVNTQNITNSLYMVVAPGEYTIKVKYTLFDTKTNKTLTLTKSYGSRTLAANTIYDIPVNLNMATSSDGGHNYYMWDAAENYWSGHEWDSTDPWQPIKEDAPTNDKDPKSKEADASRWYHEGGGSFEASVNPLFKKLPNANEMAWYVMKGDPHWDNTTQWEAFGEKHTGGIWLKKLSVIANENNKQLADLKLKNHENIDMRATYKTYNSLLISGKPKDSEINNYFFLPALGHYVIGQLGDLGSLGFYWSSSAHPSDSSYAYYLNFGSSSVYVYNGYRNYGLVAQPFE